MTRDVSLEKRAKRHRIRHKSAVEREAERYVREMYERALKDNPKQFYVPSYTEEQKAMLYGREVGAESNPIGFIWAKK